MIYHMGKAILAIKDKNGKTSDSITVDFNPSEYSISYTPGYREEGGVAQEKAVPEFLQNAKSSLSLKLTLDGFIQGNTYEESKASDITGSVKKLKSLTQISEDLHKPPKCEFQWGPVSYLGFVSNLSIQFTMFSFEGKPIRATVSMTITGTDSSAVALQSPDRTKRYVLSQDTPLYLVAYDAYDDCAHWRQIAAANGIRNPRKLSHGMVLKIPPLDINAQ